jgi:hypothetical protein
MAGFRNVSPTSHHENAINVKDGTLNLAHTPAPGVTGLQAIPGTKVVWESDAHRYMTTSGMLDARKKLPPELKQFVSFLSDLPESVVAQDYSWANLTGYFFNHNPRGGQIPHFMKDEGQSDIEAYQLSRDMILSDVTKTARMIRQLYIFLQDHRGRNTLESFWQNHILDCLAPALHTLQDSFSPAHVRRLQQPPFTMLEIFPYNKENKVHHKELDASWRASPLGEAAKNASALLIKNVIMGLGSPNWEHITNEGFEILVHDYLQHLFAGEFQEPKQELRQSAFG